MQQVNPPAQAPPTTVLRFELHGLNSSRRLLVSSPQCTTDQDPCLPPAMLARVVVSGRATELQGLTWWHAGGDE
jgi:hypothetical protein